MKTMETIDDESVEVEPTAEGFSFKQPQYDQMQAKLFQDSVLSKPLSVKLTNLFRTASENVMTQFQLSF